jgi:hypothetical protein
LTQLEVVAQRVEPAHDVTQTAPRVQVATERADLGGLLAELEEAESGRQEGARA